MLKNLAILAEKTSNLPILEKVKLVVSATEKIPAPIINEIPNGIRLVKYIAGIETLIRVGKKAKKLLRLFLKLVEWIT